jgi:hypothetical protein
MPLSRRRFFHLGLGSAALLVVAGGALVLVGPAGPQAGRLSVGGRAVFGAVARAVLAGAWPHHEAQDAGVDARARADAALAAQVDRVEAVIAAFPAATQAELAQLMSLLTTAPGRWAIAGLRPGWGEASVAEVSAALAAMRTSSLSLKVQAYQALRDLTLAAWYAEPAAWAAIGYPGPRAL